MHRTKSSKLIFLLLATIVMYGFSIMIAHAYEYKIGVSRKYYTGDQHYIYGTGTNTYDGISFTGIGYCTGYYYLNQRSYITNPSHQDISVARGVIHYDTGNITLSGDYINTKLTSSSTPRDVSQYGFFQDGGIPLFRFTLSKQGPSVPYIPLTYTLGRFWIINTQPISGTIISLYFKTPTSVDESTHIEHTSTTFNADADRNYQFPIIYYAQPCIPDGPIFSSYTTKINGNADGQYTLARVPAFNFLSNGYSNANAGRPITLGSSNFSNTSYFIPGSLNTSTFNQHLTLDNGIFFAGIKEPDKNSQPNESFDQRYRYASGGPFGSLFSILNTSFVSAPPQTTNQRGINPDTIKVTLTFTGVDKNNYGHTGIPCTIVITGDTALGLSGLGYSWNRNQLGYSITISSGTIRTLAKQQCPGFGSIATGNIDLKRETIAYLSRDAKDYSNSMIISQDYNTESYIGPNQIVGPTGYSFNSFSDVPVLAMSAGTMLLIHSTTVYNIPITTQHLRFTGTDTYAGINSGTFLIMVSGYNSSIPKSNSRRTSGTPDYLYVFSGNDINTFEFNLHNERYDYTGFVDLLSKGTITTGMHFMVYFAATDFVGNAYSRNYIFRTPTRPNAPKGGPVSLTTKSRTPIPQISLINDISQDTAADGGGPYNYLTYYPSSSGLIADFAYISGNSYIASTTDIILTGLNGEVGPSVVTVTGLVFNYNASGSFISGTPYISSGGMPMDDYLPTTFTFQILATNIYGITGVITYHITIEPSCTESPGCTDPVFVFRGTTLAEAMAQRSGAIASGYEYLMNNHRYPHRYAEIKQTGPTFYFTGANDPSDPTATVLYCASTGNQLLINHGGYSGPQGTPVEIPTSATYTGNDLLVSGGTIRLFNVYTASVSANYTMILDNGTEKMTIYVNRPLTGRIFSSVCEFTGTTLDEFGCPVKPATPNYTGDINRTKLTSGETIIITGRVEGGRFTGNRDGYLTGGSANIGDQFDFWSTGYIYNGGGTRQYVVQISGEDQNAINTSGLVSFTIENRTGALSNVSYEIYWIDTTAPVYTGYISSTQPNQSATLTLSGYNTGVLATSFEPNLIGDDEYKITKFSGSTEPQLFEGLYGSPIHTGDWYINSPNNTYKLIHTLTFASDRTGEICTLDRAGNESCVYIEVTGIGTLKDLMITIRPAFRPDPATHPIGYAITDADFRFRVKSGSEWIQNYNSATNPSNPKISTSKYGTGIVSITAPTSGAEYLVVFKGSGTLSAGFTGIRSDSLTELNFFTGSYADNFSSDFVYKYNNGGVIEHYLKVGDTVAYDTGSYDFIKDPDFAAINNNLSIGTNTLPFDWFDFDLNSVISSMEQSMILQALDSHGFIGRLDYQGIIPMTGFITF